MVDLVRQEVINSAHTVVVKVGTNVVAGPDGLGPRDIYFEGDIITDDRDAKTMTAQGAVLI